MPMQEKLMGERLWSMLKEAAQLGAGSHAVWVAVSGRLARDLQLNVNDILEENEPKDHQVKSQALRLIGGTTEEMIEEMIDGMIEEMIEEMIDGMIEETIGEIQGGIEGTIVPYETETSGRLFLLCLPFVVGPCLRW